MKTIEPIRPLLAAIAVLALLPTAAAAEQVIPPDNSAVNQYTETFPTTGGNAKDDGEPRSPKKVLGDGNAERLEAFGPDGRAAAELAAKTAPDGDGGKQGPQSASNEREGDAGDSEGSSALGEIVSQATGSSSSGGMGLLLPLVIVAAVALSGLYLWRRRGESA